MNAELIAHFFFTMPPYKTASPGMLCRPTKVAAANCQALSPVSSHCGDGTCAMYDFPWLASPKLADVLDRQAAMRALVPMPSGVVSGVVEGKGSPRRDALETGARLMPLWASDPMAIFEANLASRTKRR